MNIKTKDYTHAESMLTWLLNNVGPMKLHAGTGYRGEGWNMYAYADLEGDATIEVELTGDVDDETRVWFYLKFA